MTTLLGPQAAAEDAAQMASSYDTPFLSHTLPNIVIGGEAFHLSPEFKRRYDMWRTIRDCYAGEITVKRSGQRYLRCPKNVASSDYDTYKNRSSFYNATRRTHSGLLGAVLRKPAEFTLPASLSRTLDLNSVTIDGKSANELLREVLSELILVSRIGILSDIPEDTPAGTAPSPYLVTYKAEDILHYRRRLHKGRRIVDRVILMEQESIETEYGYKNVPLLRVLRLDPDPDAAGELMYWQELIYLAGDNRPETRKSIFVNTQGRKLRYIPFEIINPSQVGPEMEDPLLLDLVMLNLSHYEATALLQHGRFYAGMPTYYISGDQSDPLDALSEGLGTSQPMTVGPSNLWMLGKDEKAGILEFNGHGLAFLENGVDSFQLQMQSLGGKLIPTQRKAAALSSEAYGLMEAGDEVTLLDVVLSAERGITLSLHHCNDLANLPEPAEDALKTELNKEFIRSELSARELRALQTLYERGLIPVDVLYYALREVGVIPVEYTLETFKVLIASDVNLYRGDPTLRNPPTAPAGSDLTGVSSNSASFAKPAPKPNPVPSRPPANKGNANE